jgi:FkbM family methyltransferase
VTALLLANGFVVHAFEPGHHAAEVLQSRFTDNQDLTIHRRAVGARARRTVLFRDESDSLQHSQRSSLFRTGELGLTAIEQPIEVIDLFAFMTALDRPIDILKLDVEGAEFEILERLLVEGWHQRIGMILVETHERLFPEFAPFVQETRRRLRRERIRNLHLDWV